MTASNDFYSPKLFVISAPSGTGKTSIIKKARLACPSLLLSVSYATRSPREGEVDGVDYSFISKEEFEKKITQDDFIEWAEVYGNYYGTCREFIKKHQGEGRIVILDIDVQGAMQLQEKKLDAEYIFIAPPSIENLKERLEGRGSENPETLKRRLSNAQHELSFQDRYSHVIINDDLEVAYQEFLETILIGSLVQDKVRDLEDDVVEEVLRAKFSETLRKEPEFCQRILKNILTKIKR